MAIQFLCPHCSATITVPNSSHGKRGTCPACKKKLIVPRPIGDPPAIQPASQLPPAQDPPIAPAAPIPTAPRPAAPVPAAPPPIPTAPAANPFDTAAPATHPTALTPEIPKSVSASLSRKRRKRSSNAALTVGIPVGCFVIFIGVMAAIFWNSQPELKGTISGAKLPDFDLPSTKLSLANLDLTANQSESVSTEFDQQPERFISAMMKCSVGADSRQLIIKVDPSDGYEWFTVNPSSNANLLDWAQKNSDAWNAKRKIGMQQVATELCKDKLKRAAGTPVVLNAAKYRDEFALATQVKGFGYLVEAIAGSQRAVCAHEDENGTLYFALPNDTKSFLLQGRSFNKQPPVFPGSYTVKVASIAEPMMEDSINNDPSTEAIPPNKSDAEESDADSAMDKDDSIEDMNSPSMNMNSV